MLYHHPPQMSGPAFPLKAQLATTLQSNHVAHVAAVMQVFSGLLIGAMLPYWFSAMTMKSVGKAALAMVEEVRRQFATISGLMEGTARPDYRRCVEISTAVSDSCCRTHHLLLEDAACIFASLFQLGVCNMQSAVMGSVESKCGS